MQQKTCKDKYKTVKSNTIKKCYSLKSYDLDTKSFITAKEVLNISQSCSMEALFSNK